MICWYTLDENGEPVPSTVEEADKCLGDPARRRVGRDQVGSFDVSTIFLTLDHSFAEGGDSPVLWETAIFDTAGHIIRQTRCGGPRSAAIAQHEAEKAWAASVAGTVITFPPEELAPEDRPEGYVEPTPPTKPPAPAKPFGKETRNVILPT